MVTGLWTAAAMTGMVAVKMPRLALAAHLNGFLGGLWILSVAYSQPWLKYDAKQFKRLGWLTVVPAWANWLITLIASFLGVNGLEYNSDPANNGVAFGLQLLVVLPTLMASVYWLCGFCGKKDNAK